MVLECKHSFCLYCLHKWTLTTKTCPNCRVDVNPEKIPVTGLSDLENFHDAENDVEELQRPVYFMSEASRLEVTTMANYGHSTLSDHTRVAFECCDCNTFTDYRGHLLGCLCCRRNARTIPRSLFRVDLENGQVAAEQILIDCIPGVANGTSYYQKAVAFECFLRESNIVATNGRAFVDML